VADPLFIDTLVEDYVSSCARMTSMDGSWYAMPFQQIAVQRRLTMLPIFAGQSARVKMETDEPFRACDPMERVTHPARSARPVRALPSGGRLNTLFGYGTFALFTAVLNPIVPHSYIWASLLSSLLNITVAYFGYKWFVFKTKGNYLREWMRCVAVYSGGIISLCLLCRARSPDPA